MESDDRKNQIIKAATSMEFHPAEITDTAKLRGYKKIPMTEISGLGAMFSEMIPQLRTVTSTSVVNAEGLYRCTFPAGVSGQLAQFNDGSGFLGTIMNNNDVQTIKRDTLAKIKHLRSQIEKSMDKHDPVHNNQQTDQMARKVQADFQLYRMGVFMYSFATFLEVLLQEKFSKDYLDAICKDIDELAVKYKLFYTDCYNKLEHSSKSTLESKFLKGLSKASDNAGRAIRKIPVIEKGPVDEILIGAGESVSNIRKKKTEDTLQDFTKNMQSGARQFVDGIEQISLLYNSPMDVLVDKDFVYLKLA